MASFFLEGLAQMNLSCTLPFAAFLKELREKICVDNGGGGGIIQQ